MVTEVEVMTLGHTRSNAHALVDTLADTLAEVEAVRLGDTEGDTHGLFDTLVDMLADVKALTLGDMGRCARTRKHSG